MRAILCERFGGPEVLTPREVPDAVPAEGHLLVEVAGAGVNYADTHRTEGTYRLARQPPFIPGTEVIGRDQDGRRVLGLTFEGGGYAERALVRAADAVEVPAAVGDGAALALLVQGLTAWHLLRSSARLVPGESVAVSAAAGGVGSLAIQLAKHFGAGRVVAIASTVDKRELALSLGADAAVEHLREPVDVVLESTGGAAFGAALAALRPFGRLVSYGDASRSGRPPVDPAELAARNLGVAGFWLRPALERPDAFTGPLTRLLGLVAEGRITPVAGARYPLAEARRAHEDLLARGTRGKVWLRV